MEPDYISCQCSGISVSILLDVGTIFIKEMAGRDIYLFGKNSGRAGKPLLVVTTTGSEFDAYRSGGRNRFTVDELLRPYQGGAVHAGMIWQTPFVVYGMGTPDAEKNIALAADLYKKRVMALIGKDKSEDSW